MRLVCKLPDCNKPRIPGKQFCSSTHTGLYSAWCRLGKITKDESPKQTSTAPRKKIYKLKNMVYKDNFVGPHLPRRIRRALNKGIVIDRRKFMYRIDLVKLATPGWANTDAIQKLYEESKNKSKNGVKYNVDHIIPLNHPLVCGLHVESNLRIITKEENESKNNQFKVS